MVGLDVILFLTCQINFIDVFKVVRINLVELICDYVSIVASFKFVEFLVI